MSAVRINFGGLVLVVSTRPLQGLYQHVTNAGWLAQNARTIARSVAQANQAVLFGINWAGLDHDERVDWVENNILGTGLVVYVEVAAHTMDPIIGVAGDMVFTLTQQATVAGHLQVDSAQTLAQYARAIGAYVTAHYHLVDTWFGTDVGSMNAMQRTQFIAQEILAGRLRVFIPDA
jgi:hypothetical protein